MVNSVSHVDPTNKAEKSKSFSYLDTTDYKGLYQTERVTRRKLSYFLSHLRVETREYKTWKNLDKIFNLTERTNQ